MIVVCGRAIVPVAWLCASLLAIGGRPLAAQDNGSVHLSVPAIAGAGDSISPAPAMSLIATPVPAEVQPSSVQLTLSLDPQFGSPLFVGSTQNLSGQFHVDSLLPQNRRVFFRARLLDKFGAVRAETTFSRPVVTWLTLVTANQPTNLLFSRTPRFEWNSPEITLPPGLWRYTLTVMSVAHDSVVYRKGELHNTSFVVDVPLDACTSYRWSVGAHPENSTGVDSVVATSIGTFVIQTEDCPTATIFFNNFPNPFGRGQRSNQTCFWFDLQHRTAVRLTLYDARLRQVKRIIPSAKVAAVLDSGAYGRPAATDVGGCDANFSWDGLDEQGRPVPSGLYFAVFEADGKRVTHKIVFTGR
ncbi:MAG TPA: hypothetical protein VN706_22550 [Gemmatimonadaceae bacterium]|nr:hypothetical protein [Gemmatimonadaceae bacterium]